MTTLCARPLALAFALAFATPAAFAASFIYEGQLDDRGLPADGRYDLRLTAYGHQDLGTTLAAPITFTDVVVKDGRFRLDVDLPLVKSDQVWLEVAVRGSGEPTFASIPGRSKAIAAPLIGACWSATGDSGSNPATNFLGTTDAQPLVLRTANVRSLRIEPSTLLFNGSPITTNNIAGSSANTVTPGVRGATIAGGGVPTGASDPDFASENPNRVTDHYGTVGGGYANQAGDNAGATSNRPFATVGGGQSNTASGSWSTVGGGERNTASGSESTVGGGFSNTASSISSTVGGGLNNTASGAQSTVGGGAGNTASGASSTVGGGFNSTASLTTSTVSGGQNNTASGDVSTVGGGENNCAGGDWSWAGGRRAKVRPATDPGGTGPCSGLGLYPGSGGDEGTFVWADSQNANFVSSGDNQFLVRATGGIGFNTNAPNTDFDIVADRAGHAMLVENDEATTADGIAIRVNEVTPTTSNNFLSFQRSNGTNVGSVRGNGAGGVVFNTTGADYAEYLPLGHGLSKTLLRPGMVVALRDGAVSLDTAGAQQLGVVSTNPAVSGSDPGEAERESYALIAFLGQVDVAVSGPVAAGDYLIASGRGDGSAIGVPPAAMSPAHLAHVVGRAWTGNDKGEATVRALVGLNPVDAAQAEALRQLNAENAELRAESADLRAESADLRARLDRLEAALMARAGEGR